MGHPLSGQKAGVQAKIHEKQPKALYTKGEKQRA